MCTVYTYYTVLRCWSGFCETAEESVSLESIWAGYACYRAQGCCVRIGLPVV